MSQKVPRKTTVGDEKSQEKRHTDSPVKDAKKKMAATTEKEKQSEKPAEKVAEKNASVSDKKESKNERAPEKKEQKNDKVEKKEQKNDKVEKKEQKNDKVEKKEAEKPKEDASKGEKSNNKPQETPDEKAKKPDQSKSKQNGNPKPHNGVTDVTLSNGNGNGTEDLTGDTVSGDSDDDVILVISDQEQDELFPELTYDDSEDFEPPTPENRSLTRRSQVKSTRTPETPRPSSDKQTDNDDTKVLKLKDDVTTERKLRSSDSPKPETKKQEPGKKNLEKPVETKKTDKAEKAQDNAPKTKDNKVQDEKENAEKSIVEVVVEDVEGNTVTEERRKADTNFSKSRVKVSPYRRSMRVADQTTTSITANYTGNNTTMEMDITETSIAEEATALNDSAYLSGLRSISARKSYKTLNDLNIRPVVRTAKQNASITSVISSEGHRPTAPVVGRKRRQASSDEPQEPHHHHHHQQQTAEAKRPRLIDRIPLPFRNHRAQQIVGINTDLPLSAPVVAVDPESLKTTDTQAVTLTESKRCIIM